MPAVFGAVERADHAAVDVGDRDLDVAARRRLQVVVDRRAARRVLADEDLLPADLLVVLLIVQLRDRRTDVEQRRVLRRAPPA